MQRMKQAKRKSKRTKRNQMEAKPYQTKLYRMKRNQKKQQCTKLNQFEQNRTKLTINGTTPNKTKLDRNSAML